MAKKQAVETEEYAFTSKGLVKKRKLGPRSPARKIGKGLGVTTRYAGKGLRATGKGLFEFGAGVKEGIGPIRVSVRDIGRVAGESTRLLAQAGGEGWKALRRYTPPGYLPPKQLTQAQVPVSHLPMEIQQAMVTVLGETQPEIFKSLWEPGIRVSSFIGKLRLYYPELHTEMRDAIYQSVGMRYTGDMTV